MTQRCIEATGTFLCITIQFVLLAIKLFAIQSDLSRQRCMKQQRSETSNTCLCITIRFVLLAVSFSAIRSGPPRQRLLAHRRIETTRTSPCIMIRFVLLLTTIFHYDMICPAADNKYLLQYDLSYWQSSFCNTI